MSAGQLSSTTLTLSYLARIREVDDELQRRPRREPTGAPGGGAQRPPPSPRRAAQRAGRRPRPAQGQHRRGGRATAADHRWIPGAAAQPPGGRRRAGQAAPGGRRRDHRQGEPVGVGQLPQHQLVERVERSRRADRQRLRPRSQSLRLVVGFGRRCRRVARPGGDRHRDRRFDRVPGRRQRRRRAQAHPRVGLACRGRADLGAAGHGGPDGPSRRRRRAHPGRAAGLRSGRSGHRCDPARSAERVRP